jgi:transposase-like protein
MTDVVRPESEGPSTGTGHNPNRQVLHYCPYCAEETLFPREGGGWECHSCLRAFSVAFLGLVSRERAR